jgi:hypothetical protein
MIADRRCRGWFYALRDVDVQDYWQMKLHQAVRLRHDLPGEGLRKSDLGAIIHVSREPRLAYEVEFVYETGRTRAQVTLLPDQFRAASERRVPAAAGGVE